MSLRALWLRLTYPLRKARMDRELRDEMSLHLSLRTEQLVDSGLARDDAVAAARKRFGNQPRIAAAARDTWGWRCTSGASRPQDVTSRWLSMTCPSRISTPWG